MAFEIEKKFLVGNYNYIFNFLKNNFKNYNEKNKSGFWFCSNINSNENILDLKNYKFLKKDVESVKDIGEFILQLMDYQFIRLRIINNLNFSVTFKNKYLQHGIEKNIEYEFEVEKDILIRIINYLKETSNIFYYNIKNSIEFKYNDISIELSKFNDLKDAYLEIEVTGENETQLFNKLDNFLKTIDTSTLKEESRNYVELSRIENMNKLKNMKLFQYSKEAFKELNKIII